MNLAALGHNIDSIFRLEHTQRAVVRGLAASLDPVGEVTPLQGLEYLKDSFKQNKLSFRDEIFDDIEGDDSLEMWANSERKPLQLDFIFAMGPLMRLTSYENPELASTPWSELFGREPFFAKQIATRFEQALKTRETQRFVADWHDVYELRASRPRHFQVKVKQITPFLFNNGTMGVCGLIKSRPTFV